VMCLQDAAKFIQEPLAQSLALLLCGDTEQAVSILSKQAGSLGKDVDATCLASIMNATVPGAKQFAHKALLASALAKSGKQELAPKTWLVKNEEDVKAIFSEGSVHAAGYFVKNPAVNRGQGVSIVHTLEQALAVPGLSAAKEAWVVQLAVDPPMLIRERKFGLRVHALVVIAAGTPHLYIFRESILTLCGAEYDLAKDDSLVHVACTSVQRHLEGYVRETVKGPGSLMWPTQYEDCWPSVREAVAGAVMAVWGEGGTAVEEGGAGTSMQLFGCDVMVDATGKALLLEANIAPQLGDAQAMEELKARIGLPMINSIPYVLQHAIQSVEGSELIECDGAPMPWSCWEPVSLASAPGAAPEEVATEGSNVLEQ